MLGEAADLGLEFISLHPSIFLSSPKAFDLKPCLLRWGPERSRENAWYPVRRLLINCPPLGRVFPFSEPLLPSL